MPFITQGKTNWKYISLIILLTIFVSCGIFSYQIVEGQELSNPLKAQPKDVAGGIFSLIFNLGLLVLFPIFIFFVISYFLISLGLKILKIEGISRSKIVVYIFMMFLLGSFLQPAVNKFLGNAVNMPTLYLINTLISFGIALLLLKYYFLLFGKKLWQFLLYLIALNLIFSGVITLMQLL
ncbi:hypothetical protein ACFL0A_02085 [Patescibacteria group bacterium]